MGLTRRCLGGIKTSNVLRTLHGSVSTTGHKLDGIAVVSELISSSDPEKAAHILSASICAFKEEPAHTFSLTNFDIINTGNLESRGPGYMRDSVIQSAADMLNAVRSFKPLVHQVRNVMHPGVYINISPLDHK
jgi:thiamine-phosphate diphosphorylase / hydroxyethylthiazole kinase